MDPSPEHWLTLNRANWDERVAVHAASDFYDLPRFRAGGPSTLRSFEPAEIGPVEGRSLLHLQCHMGQDTLSWAMRGARVTGLDFSEPAISTATGLAGDCGLADRARFVVSDVYAAAEALAGERYDIVYTGIGALVWLPDLPRWARIVASLLNEGGALYLVEMHPFTNMFDEDPRTMVRDYFAEQAQTWSEPHTYTDGPALTANTGNVQWDHTLGTVVSAICGAGLRLEFLHEHDRTLFARFPSLQRDDQGEYTQPDGEPKLPLMFSLRAVKD